MKRLLTAATLFTLAACSSQTGNAPSGKSLLNPNAAEMAKPAPDEFKVKFQTSKGDFVVEVHRDWAPLGTDRFYYLVNNGFYDGVRFFRTLPNFVVQFGLNGDPNVSKAWGEDKRIQDDSVKQSNQAGYITYAMGGPNTRTTQIFINKVDNSRLDAMGFAPFGKVIEGMHVVDQFYGGYADNVPDQGLLRTQGNSYLDRMYPKLDSIVKATIISVSSAKATK